MLGWRKGERYGEECSWRRGKVGTNDEITLFPIKFRTYSLRIPYDLTFI